MAARPSLLRYSDNSILRARNGAPDEEEIPLRIHLHHSESELGMALGAHVTRHPLALDHARGVGARADRAGLPVAGIAVGRRTATEVVAMHHALEATTLGRAGHLDQLTRGEDIHLHFGAGGRRIAIDREDPQHLGCRLEPGL